MKSPFSHELISCPYLHHSDFYFYKKMVLICIDIIHIFTEDYIKNEIPPMPNSEARTIINNLRFPVS